MKISQPSALSAITLFFYSAVLGSGYIGYGIDVQKNYLLGKIVSYSPLDAIGTQLSILRFNSLYLGVFLTTFLMVSSITLFYCFYLKLPILKTSLYLIPLFLSWPVILPTLNALRQGISTAFFIFLLYFFYKTDTVVLRKTIIILVFSLLVIFSHKIGIILIFSFLIQLLYFWLQRIKAPNPIIATSVVLSLFFLMPLLLSVNYSDYESRTVGLDLRFLIFPLFFAAVYSCINSFSRRYANPNFSLSFFLLILYTISFFFALFGFSYQVERIIMFSLIPAIPLCLNLLNVSPKLRLSLLMTIGLLFGVVTMTLTPFYGNLRLGYA